MDMPPYYERKNTENLRKLYPLFSAAVNAAPVMPRTPLDGAPAAR
jgi:hypothetical protein